MQRTWRGKSKSRKKNKHRRTSQKWNSGGEDAFYKKLDRRQRRQRQEELDELEQYGNLSDSDEIDDLKEAELSR